MADLSECSFCQCFTEGMLDGLRNKELDFKNEIDAFMKEGIERLNVLYPNLSKSNESASDIIDKHLDNIIVSFTKIKNLLKHITESMLHKSLNESDYSQTFKEIYNCLQDIFQSVKDIREMIRDNDVNVDMVNTAIDGVQACFGIINTYIKKLNKGKVPEWFLKDNSTVIGDNWNYKLQAVYFACVIGAETFLTVIDRIRKKQNGVIADFDLDSLNLMKQTDATVLNALSKSKTVSEFKQKAIGIAYKS